ncbi:hypothetical protein MTO96_044883 [Rhipicephalus appendiculatus]
MPDNNPTKETNAKLERFEQQVLHEIKEEIQETHPEVDWCRQTGEDPPVAGDAQVIEVELAKHKVRMNDIQADPGSVDTLNTAGHQLIEVDRHSECASVTQTDVANLNRRWKALQDKAAERQPQLEAVLREAQALNREIQELLTWLSDSGSQLASSKPVGGLPATLAEPREKLQNRRAKWRKKEDTKKGPGRTAHNAHPRTCSGEPIPPEEIERRERNRREKKLRKQLERQAKRVQQESETNVKSRDVIQLETNLDER